MAKPLAYLCLTLPLLFSSASTPTWASGERGLDESAFFAARLLPSGLALGGTLGYGQLLWGENSEGNVLFGYVRPSVTATTSVLLNRAEVGVDLFPVSFLGLYAGARGSQRAVDLDTLNCTSVYCRGLLGTAYLKPQLLLGYGPVSAMASFQTAWLVSSNSPSNSMMPFGDDVSNLAGNAGGDQLIGSELAVQVKLDPAFATGTYLSTAHMLGSGSTNDLISVFGRYLRGALSYTAGVGAYESTTQTRAFTCYGVVSWSGIAAMGLR